LEEYAKLFDIPYTLPVKDYYKNCYVIKGFVLDTTGRPLQNVSICVGNKELTKTDEFGYYLVSIKKHIRTAEIRYIKQGFQGGIIILKKEDDRDFYEKFMWLSTEKILLNIRDTK
jgi:hypothetical protein